jgi:pyridinium-3,5-biscarboxylic acid mononucleotide sulfurtransferase
VQDKLVRLRGNLQAMGRVLVAFSGGVDSSFLLRVAADELEGDAVALTTHSPTGPEDDRVSAARLAKDLGVRHIVIEHDELRIPGYAANPIHRCYLCKQGLYEICWQEAAKCGIKHVTDGVNADDLNDYRPGLEAARERSVRHPLAEVGLTKAEIRQLSHEMGLATWDRPASPCLSSRFPYGTPITPEGLRMVGEAERVLRNIGFRECRVRFHDPIARVEVPAEELPRLLAGEVRASVLRELKTIGFRYVTVDLEGYRTGSLNEVILPPPENPEGRARGGAAMRLRLLDR